MFWERCYIKKFCLKFACLRKKAINGIGSPPPLRCLLLGGPGSLAIHHAVLPPNLAELG